MKDLRDVLIAPVVSEKSYEQFEKGVYIFKVHNSASKPEIRQAVEFIFDVKVTNVNTLNRKARFVATDEITRLENGQIVNEPSSPSPRVTRYRFLSHRYGYTRT